MKNAVYAIRFLCEVAAVVAFVWHGWIWQGIAIGCAVILFWGFFVAPKAPRRLRDPLRLVSELVIFLGATAAFVEVGQHVVALVFGVCAVCSAGLVRRWPEPV
jgi:hypothetical protein